jgi:hypothetical protein
MVNYLTRIKTFCIKTQFSSGAKSLEQPCASVLNISVVEIEAINNDAKKEQNS